MPFPRTGSPAARAALLALALCAVAGGSVLTPGASAAASRATCPVVGGAGPVPSPSAVLGRDLTAAPPQPEDTDRYVAALAAASPRIATGIAGRSAQGRPLRYAVVGDPRQVTPSRLAAISARARAVRAGATGAAAVARAARGPALVWLGGGVHANEPSGTTALLAELQRLAGDDSCATRRTLHGVVAVVVPDQNPDGHVAGTRTDASGFDLNRDWFAAARPETRARLALLRRYPPAVAIDAHEQAGGDYFVPPYADPVIDGLPAATRRLADRVVAPAATRALRAAGATVAGGRFDLLYPGYGDSATSLLFGAGGMTFEQGSDLPLAEKTRRHATAIGAALAAVARHRDAAIRGWAAGFAAAVRDGRAGRTTGGDGPAFGWVLRTDRHAGDAHALAVRLRSEGVRVRALRRPAVAHAYRALGARGSARVRLPAGTIVVPADQPLQRWADALLGHDADEAGTASDGEDTWSMPRLAGVDSGTLGHPLPASLLGPLRPPAAARAGTGAAVAFAADSAAAATLALHLLGAGRSVTRDASGAYRTTADADLARRAASAGIPLQPVAGGVDAAGTVRLAAPSVTVVADGGPPMVGPPAALPGTGGDRPGDWTATVLAGAGVATTVVPANGVGTGLRPGTTHLILGPGALPPGGWSPAARAVIDGFAQAGGRVVALGEQGVAAAAAAGVSAVTTTPAASSGAVNVAAVPSRDPVGAALGGPARVVVEGEPRLSVPAGAAVPLRAASAGRLTPSGPQGGAAGLAGRPLVVDEPRGTGHVLSVGFSPVFRGQSAGGTRVLLGLLLPAR